MNDYLAAAAVSQPTGDLTEIERIAAYWEDQARRGCVDAFQCALKEAWSTAIATYLARQPKAEQAEPAKVQGDANDVLALLGEADDLLFIASDAMLKMGLRDKGSDCGLPHEVRRFALEFSNEGRDGPGALQVRGTGRYRAWLTAARKIDCAAPASQEGAHLARQAQAEGAAPTVAQAAGRSAGDILSKLESRLSWMLDDDQYKNIQAMLLAVRGQLGAEGVASIAPPANVESFVTEAGFWVRREERVDKTHGWLLCDATDRIICALTPAERDLVDGAIAACQAPAPAEAKSATSIAPASPAGAQNAEAIRNQAESISAADQNTEWSYDLQTRLIAASQDLAQDDDARQVMAEAACLLAALTGSANTQEGGAE
jgi:hypothetical protein